MSSGAAAVFSEIDIDEGDTSASKAAPPSAHIPLPVTTAGPLLASDFHGLSSTAAVNAF